MSSPGGETVARVLESFLFLSANALAVLAGQFEELGLLRLVLLIVAPVGSGEKPVQPDRPSIFRIHERGHITRGWFGGVNSSGLLISSELGGGARERVGVEEGHSDACQPPLLRQIGFSPLMGPFL